MAAGMPTSSSTLVAGGLSGNACLIRVVATAAAVVRHPPATGYCALLHTSRPLVAAPAFLRQRKRPSAACSVLEQAKRDRVREGEAALCEGAELGGDEKEELREVSVNLRSMTERMARKRAERRAYLVAAVMSSLGITSMAVAAVYYRFAWQVEGGEIPLSEMFGTFALSVGAAVGMEFWARWAHRELWHASLWHMHESHHRPREGPFEINDVFAITNAFPAITLLSFGFFNSGFFPGLCFGAGLGITLYGMAYMFVHDGLVHRRFAVGPLADVPYFRKVAAAHQIHHMDKFDGVPYGLFLGPKELEEVGDLEELEKEISKRLKLQQQQNSENSSR